MSVLWRRQLDSYPGITARTVYLAITVLATITMYYELYVVGSVSTLVLANLHMSFTFFVSVLGFGNLIGAFGSLFAGIADRWGRANLVVGGLLLSGLFTLVIIPTATSRWAFGIEYFVVGLIEGVCLVATPALIRDFSPQMGRATAMGFWTSGPVVGSLVVAVVGSATIPAVVHHSRVWTDEYRICGVAGLTVFLIALIGLRELAPSLRDQLMVTTRDRALIEARARGLDVRAALRHPWRQLVKADVILSSIAVSIMLLIYYTAVGFSVIYLTTVFGFSVKDATGLGNWYWGFNIIAVIVIGPVSDYCRVRKPFMVIGAAIAAAMAVVYLLQAGHHPSYHTLAMILAVGSFGLGVAYTPWMASFTETVEARNPALTATGLAIWGWILRVVACISFLVIPVVVNSVTPLVNYGTTVTAYAVRYKSQIAFTHDHPVIVATAKKIPPLVLATAKKIPPQVQATAQAIPPSVQATAKKIPPRVQATAQRIPPSVQATAQRDATQAANARKFAPELAVMAAYPTLFAELADYPSPATIPPALMDQAIAAAGGGPEGLYIINTILSNQAAIAGVIAAEPALKTIAPYTAGLKTIAPYTADLDTIAPYSAQLAALAKVPPGVFSYLRAHAAAVERTAAHAPGQWQVWYWVCFGAMLLFVLSIPLMRGRWKPSDARRDVQQHAVMVEAELASLRS